jgi:hypothetical protein
LTYLSFELSVFFNGRRAKMKRPWRREKCQC